MISRGHGLEAVLRGYTLDQLEAFGVAAARNRKQEMLELATVIRMATQAPKGPWAKFLKELSAGTSPSPEARPLDRAGVERLRAMLWKKPKAGRRPATTKG